MPAYADLYQLPEDDRIREIGRMVMLYGKTAAFMVDAEGEDGMEKANRYKQKLEKTFPGIVVERVGFFDKTKKIMAMKASPPKVSVN